MFKQDSVPAHRACKMVEFLARETPDFKAMLLSAHTMNIFYHRTRWSLPSKQITTVMTAPVETSKLVLTTHYGVSVTSSKKYLINSHILLRYFKLVFFQLQLVKFCVSW